MLELLLVEDEVGDILLILQAIREEAYEIRVHVAVDGLQAIHMIEDRYIQPDLIILDLNLPKVTGFAFLERFRVNAPIVVFTSSSNPQESRRALELGAKDVIEKPTDLDDYARQVVRILRRWAPLEGNAVSSIDSR